VEHCLCSRKSRERRWQITTLGRYILELPPFETIVTILASEVALSQRQQNRFVNRQLLRDLQSSQAQFRGALPYSLRMFDLVGEPEHGSQTTRLTPLGERVIDTVLQSDDRLQDLILVMLESEVEGLHMFSQHPDEHIQASLEATSLLAFDDKESVKRAATLAQTGSYVDALRLLFPLVERVVDTTIKQVGLSNSGSGMAKKVGLLESQGILSHETASFAEITAARNKVAHGNIGRNDHQLLRPLFEFSFGYLGRLVQEAEAALSRGVTATNL
jgi:hypothetical protein